MVSNTSAPTVQIATIKVDGSLLSTEIMSSAEYLEVDTTLDMPSMFILRLHDPELRWIDSTTPFEIGKTVEISLPKMVNNRPQMAVVFKGEITAIEPEFALESPPILIIRGYDKAHRLNRGTKTRTYVNASDGDIVRKIAQENGLTAEVGATPQVHKHVFQHSETDLAFLHKRARLHGYEVYVDDRKLYFQAPRGSRGSVSLEWGTNLLNFRARLSAANQVNEVTVKGWDPQNKQAITGRASNSSSAPQIGVGTWGGAKAQTAFSGAAKVLEIHYNVSSQAEADKLAQAILDEINANFVEAEGVAFGNPELLAGQKVTISSVGTRFGGDYIITAARHIYGAEMDYTTEFIVEGRRPQLLSDLVKDEGGAEKSSPWGGLVIGIVTDNNDPENLGRVKLKFPWLDDSLGTDWVRVVSVGAGNERGFMVIPEVNDEVAVAFEHGDFNHPYVLGGLWNGQDKPPDTTANVIKNGNVERRLFKTRAGHIIRLDDDTKVIEIIDCDNQVSIKLDGQNKKIIVTSQGDLEMKSTGNMKIEATGNIEMKSTGNMKLEATGTADVKSAGPLGLKTDATATLQASGPTTVKGAIVQIN
jgi:phage protein D/phage baseplate assembly protein gpV